MKERFTEKPLKEHDSQKFIEKVVTKVPIDDINFQFKIELSSKKDNLIVVKDICSNDKKFNNEFSLNKQKNQNNYSSKLKETSPLRCVFNEDKESSPIKRWLKQTKNQ